MADNDTGTAEPFHPAKRHHLMRNAPFLGFTRKHGWVVLEPARNDPTGAYLTRPGQWRVLPGEVTGFAPLPMGAHRG